MTFLLKKTKILDFNKKSEQKKRYRRWAFTLIFLFLILLVAIITALNMGFSSISFGNIIKILANNVPLIGPLANFSVSEIEETLIIQVRLPRLLCAALVGAALSAAGSVYQGLFRNPMADPYTIGASAGAALGVTVSIVFGLNIRFFGISSIPFFAFIGCISSVLLVYAISKVGTRVPVQTLLLSGIAVSIFLSAIVSYLQTLSPEKLHQSQFWLMGSFSYSLWSDVISAAPFIITGVLTIYLYARDLNIMALGEDEARHLGVDVEKMKGILLIASTFVTAAAVSISGLIAFVGLIIPHLTRLLIGPDHRILIPASVLMGASFLIICDGIARVVVSPAELPVGVITAMCGGPFFLYLMHRKKKHTLL